MKKLCCCIFISTLLFAQKPLPSPTQAGAGGGGGGSGTVTSVGLVGTANQITVTGASPNTSSGSWTLSFPAGGVTLPGTTTGTFTGNLTGNASGSAGSVLAAGVTAGSFASGTYTFPGTLAIGTSFSVDGTTGLAATAKFPWTVNALVKGGGAGVAPIITGITVDASDNLAVPGTGTFGMAGTLGTLGLSGNTSGVVTIKPQAVAGTYNFNLPTSAGTTGCALLSQGGGSTAQIYDDNFCFVKPVLTVSGVGQTNVPSVAIKAGTSGNSVFPSLLFQNASATTTNQILSDLTGLYIDGAPFSFRAAGGGSTFVVLSNATTGSVTTTVSRTITGTVADGYTAGLFMTPTYSAATAQTVTRHNYINLANPVLAGVGPAALTDAAVFSFPAAAGTHKAVDSGTTKTTPGGVDAWMKININGTIYYVPAFTSKTS